MNAAVEKKHILQTVNWSRFDLEGWLYQFGAWIYINSGPCGKSLNPIAVAMENAAKKRKKFKMGVKQKRQVIADYFASDVEFTAPKKNKHCCEISDNEARAVQRLVLDMMGQSDVLDNWMDAIIDRYFYGCSWSQMKNNERTEMDARMDVKCGLAALHCRYIFINVSK